jgi:hypothetical protein
MKAENKQTPVRKPKGLLYARTGYNTMGPKGKKYFWREIKAPKGVLTVYNVGTG